MANSPFGAGRGRGRAKTKTGARPQTGKRTGPLKGLLKKVTQRRAQTGTQTATKEAGEPNTATDPGLGIKLTKDPKTGRITDETGTIHSGPGTSWGYNTPERRSKGKTAINIVGADTEGEATDYLERMKGRAVDLEGGEVTPAKAMEMLAKGQSVPTSMLPRSMRGDRWLDTKHGRQYKTNWYDSKGQIHAPEEIDPSGGKESSPAPTSSRGEGMKFFGSFNQPKRFQDDEKDPTRGANEAHLTPAQRLYGGTSPGEFERAQTASVKTPAAVAARAQVKAAGGMGRRPGYKMPKGKQLQKRQKLAERIFADISNQGGKKEELGWGEKGRNLLMDFLGKSSAAKRATEGSKADEERIAGYVKEGGEAGLSEEIVRNFFKEGKARAVREKASKKAAKKLEESRQGRIDTHNERMAKKDAAALLKKKIADMMKEKADEEEDED